MSRLESARNDQLRAVFHHAALTFGYLRSICRSRLCPAILFDDPRPYPVRNLPIQRNVNRIRTLDETSPGHDLGTRPFGGRKNVDERPDCHNKLQHAGTGSSHGLVAEEFGIPYTAFSEAGASIRMVSPKGGAVAIDPKTAPTEQDREKWPAALQALASTEGLAEVAADGFDAVYLPGGHGPMVDLVNDQDLQRLLAAFDRDGKIIAAVCPAERAECGGGGPDQRAKGHRLHQPRGAIGHASQRGAPKTAMGFSGRGVKRIFHACSHHCELVGYI